VSVLKIVYINEKTDVSSEIILTPNHYLYLREYSQPVQAKEAKLVDHFISSKSSSLRITDIFPMLVPSSDMI